MRIVVARKLQNLGIFLAEMMTNVSIILLLGSLRIIWWWCIGIFIRLLWLHYTHPEQYILLHFLVILIITVLCFGLNDHIFLRFKKQDVYFFFIFW